MKKFFFLLALPCFFSLAFAQSVSFSVVNTSRENKDATQEGARPGDTLRYSFVVQSDQDVLGFVPQVEISDVLAKSALIDAGLGSVSGTQLVFPEIQRVAPVREEFSFFVRVNPDCPRNSQNILASFSGEQLQVPIVCELVPTGFGYNRDVLFILAFLIFVIALFLMFRRQHN